MDRAAPAIVAKEVTIVHASTISVNGRGALILGASGSGKSALALQLMAYGAHLVADDKTELVQGKNALIASSPKAIAGFIEARYVGILTAQIGKDTHISVAIDLDKLETERLPELRHIEIAGNKVPCLYKVDSPYFPAAILQYLKSGRREPS